MAVKIAAQTYTIREFLKTPADIAASLERLAKIGYRFVQLSGMGEIPTAELKDILDSNGLACIATHVGYPAIIEQTEQIIEHHVGLGCSITAVGYLPDELHNLEGAVKFAKDMDAAGSKLKTAGISLGYHNHKFEFEKFDGKLLMDHIFDNCDRQNVFAEIDTYWVHHGGADPAAWIRKFANHIPLVHFKDFGIIEDKVAMLEVGEGNLNWPDIIAACGEAGVEYAAIEQDDCNGRDPFESLEISFENCKAMGLEV
jgi:sugar phosphate isomerase/epimerase